MLVPALVAGGLWLAGVLEAPTAIGLHCLIVSSSLFVLFFVDKRRAVRGARRASEANLLWIAALGGAAGGLAGMTLFRHKSRHLRFRVLLPLFLIAHIALVLVATDGSLP